MSYVTVLNGCFVKCHGECDAPLKFGNFVLRHNVIVGDLDGCKGILGVDVLNNHKGVLNLGGGYLDLGGHIILLDHSSFVSTPACFYNAYPLPNAEELIDELSGSRWFSTLDLASGYWQVELDPIDREKTAFTFHGKGLFHFKVMCFGLTNAPATFQRLMETVLKRILWKICVVYMDDVICYADKFQAAYNNLKIVF